MRHCSLHRWLSWETTRKFDCRVGAEEEDVVLLPLVFLAGRGKKYPVLLVGKRRTCKCKSSPGATTW